jgi:membrane protein required for colicin V production
MIPLSEITLLDWIVLIILAVPAVIGIFKGFFRIAFRFMGILFGFGLGIVFSRPFGNFLKEIFNFDYYFTGRLTAFIVIFTGCWFAGFFLGHLFRKIMQAIKMGWFDRCMGFFLGLFEGAGLVVVICIVLVLIPSFQSILLESRLTLPLVRGTVTGVSYLPDPWKHYLDPHRWIGQCKEKMIQVYQQDQHPVERKK